MTPDLFLRSAVVPGFGALPAELDSVEARATVLAIALQESGLRRRTQMGGGPARSFVQFERAGIAGVLRHEASAALAADVCRAFVVPATVDGVYVAIEYQDALCAAFARLLLRTSPLPLGGPTEPPAGWRIYLDAWRPGAPRPDAWRDNFALAWSVALRARQTDGAVKA